LAEAESLETEWQTKRDTYQDLWEIAAEASERRATLEEELATFDDRVEEAKKAIGTLSEARRAIREEIADDTSRIGLLQQQLLMVSDADASYASLAIRLRAGLADFARFVAVREIAADAGPAASSVLLRPFLSGSLGEHIDDALARDAVLRARAELLTQASVMAHESDRVKERLVALAGEYDLHLAALEEEQQRLGRDEDRAAAFIDQSWRTKTLTQSELSSVAAEASEAAARVSAMQDDLLSINETLKQQKLSELLKQKEQTTADMSALSSEIDSLERRDTAMRLLEEAALRALQETVQQRNTDRKLYQKIEVQKLTEKNLLEERAKLAAADPVDDAALAAVDQKLLVTREILKEMKQGVPEDVAIDYVHKKLKAAEATKERARILVSIAELRKKQAEVSRALSTAVAGIESVEAQFGIAALAPAFVWPVKGPISAGYLDSDYVKVFGVNHRAIDIVVPQGTPIRAATDGIVHTVRDGGATGYSYVLIGHRNGYATLYGHVSSFLVKSGDIVRAGQSIALSGGTPGTHGAGHMTTGAHVHFEVLKNGVHVDPRSMLP